MSFNYRYTKTGYLEGFFQKVKNTSQNYDLIQSSLKLRHTFQNRHHLELWGQYFYYHKHYPNDAKYFVLYTIPLDVPIMRKKDRGDLVGLVYNTRDQKPVSKALVSCNGQKKFTDSEGRFAFYKLPVGEHLLKTELLPDPLVGQDNRTQNIEIKGNKKSETVISVLPSCTIKGKIILYDYEDSLEHNYGLMYENKLGDKDDQETDLLKETRRLEDVQVVIKQLHGEVRYSAFSNRAGYFNFQKLQPGKWQIFINPEALSSDHDFESDSFLVEVEPGEVIETTFKALPKKIKIMSFD